MSKLSALLNLLKNKASNDDKPVPEGYCPNCWGRQEYGGRFYETVKNSNLDINDNDSNVGWVQDYANKHLAGIELLKEDEQLVCQKCKVSYQPD